MLVVVAAVIGALAGAAGSLAGGRALAGRRAQHLQTSAALLLADARREAEALRREATIDAREESLRVRAELEAELHARHQRVADDERRIGAKEEELESRLLDLARSAQGLSDRETHVTELQQELRRAHAAQLAALEQISGLSVREAERRLVAETEEGLRHELADRIRRAEAEYRQEARRRARNLVADALQRVAAGATAEATVTVVELESDAMKGRIIGREGRNIRALERLTGVDVIIDDTPNAVVLSSFDGLRREVARITLELLIEDGRIHPTRIEDVYAQARAQLDEQVHQAGVQAVDEAGVGRVPDELVGILGRLRFRTSHGQNVLAHTLEVVQLAGIMAAELGASVVTAKRAALLHDLGKALTHEVEGSHAQISTQLARRHGESAAVCHAIEAHHHEVEPQTVEAVIVIAADAISASRPGARGEGLEHYVKRLEALEALAASHAGVERVYALQAGREIRVLVKPEEIDDDAAVLLSHEIAREIEERLDVHGEVRVTVIRESRAVDVAANRRVLGDARAAARHVDAA